VISGRQTRALMALLVTAMPGRLSADELLEELWTEPAPASARHALQVYVSRIRAGLREAGLPGEVLRGGGAYEIGLPREMVDATHFELALVQGRASLAADPARAREQLEAALGWWRGPALREFEDVPRLRAEGARLGEERIDATELLAEAHLRLASPHEVIAFLRPLVAANPLRERPRALLMRALYQTGRHVDALTEYAELRDAMQEIGLIPTRELRDLQAAVLRHDDAALLPSPSAAAASPPAAALLAAAGAPEAAVAHVPDPRHRLVGRRREIDAVGRLLFDRGARLVTVMGPGGAGKTRLALELGLRFADRLAGGSWFVPLAPLNDPRLVLAAIARELAIDEAPGQSVDDTLLAWLADRELLLVLDNFEHVMAARADLARLLANVPGARLVVTSRRALGIRGEHRLHLPPLPSAEAIELFLDRAREIRPEIGEAPGDAPALQRIVEGLDGLPLALELVAARTAVFSLPALAERLGDRLDVRAAHDAPSRQRTLRDTIDWSYRLLSADEQRLLRTLSAFYGGARLEAIEAALGPPPLNLVELVSSLAGQSLLRPREDPDDAPRFAMLVTIWEFAREMLERAGEPPGVLDRHASHFLHFAQESADGLYGSELLAWIERLELDEENCRVAREHLIRVDPPRAARMVAAMGMFWDAVGNRAEAEDQLSAALPMATEPWERGRIGFWLGRLRFRANDPESALPLFTDALACARTAGDIRTEVYALAYLALMSPPPTGGVNVAMFEAGLAAARADGDPWALNVALATYGDALQMAEQTGPARPLLDEALALARQTGNPLAINVTTSILGELAARTGDLPMAESLMSEALASAQEIPQRWLVVANLGDLAVIALQRGDRRPPPPRASARLAGPFSRETRSRRWACSPPGRSWRRCGGATRTR
jgi:predicted ATPase/DNA-binding SARP family transcriptional activator